MSISDERLAMLLDGAKLDAKMQTSARYKREAEETVLILAELQSLRAAVPSGEEVGAPTQVVFRTAWEIEQDRLARKDALSAAAKVRAGREGDCRFVFDLRPMDTAPDGEEALEPSEIEVHDGAWAVVMGTNAKPIGWIDTNALFAGRTYRDRLALSTQEGK